MLPADFAQLSSRTRYSESCRLYKYLDDRGVPTLGWGLNLRRNDLAQILIHVGASVSRVLTGPTAPTSHAADAVAACIEQSQADAIFDYLLPGYVASASALLAPGIFEAFNGPRQCAWGDLAYNMGTGSDGLGGFVNTISLLNQAQRAKNAGNLVAAHTSFIDAAQHLEDSAWFGQVGDRAKRNVAMIRAGEYCAIDGDGSDLAA